MKINKISRFLVWTIFLLASIGVEAAQADLLCAKKKTPVQSSKVKLGQALVLAQGSCPAGFKEILNTDNYLPSTAPSGTTFTGPILLIGTASGAGVLASSSFSFPMPLPSGSAGDYVHYIRSGEAKPTGCPGTSSSPQADPGHFCAYEETTVNAGQRNVTSPSGDDSITPHGGGFFLYSAGGGTFFALGHWAYTVP